MNVGLFVAAALLLDVVLWILVLVGRESVVIPAEFARTHQPAFVFPYSHGLAAALAWSVLAAAVAWAACARHPGLRGRAAVLTAAAVFSHWLLDALVHRPEMPLAGAGSAVVGLSLWDRMPVALLVEAAVLAAGLLLFVRGAGLSRGRALAFTAAVLVVLVFTVVGMTIAPPPPSAHAMAATSLATIVAVCALIGWLGRPSAATPVVRADA
ncbi:MAG: hypothetical protein U1F58_08400 [Burkholderiales bacterium]